MAKARPTFVGRTVGCLVADGADPGLVGALRAAAERAGGQLKVVAPKVGGAVGADGSVIEADFQLAGGPSVLFDGVTIVAGPSGADALAREAAAVAFVHDAFSHLKVIGFTDTATGLLAAAGVKAGDAGLIPLGQGGAERYVQVAAQGRIWAREPAIRMVA